MLSPNTSSMSSFIRTMLSSAIHMNMPAPIPIFAVNNVYITYLDLYNIHTNLNHTVLFTATLARPSRLIYLMAFKGGFPCTLLDMENNNNSYTTFFYVLPQ